MSKEHDAAIAWEKWKEEEEMFRMYGKDAVVPRPFGESGEFFTRGGGPEKSLCSRNRCPREASVKIRWAGYTVGDYTCGECAEALRSRVGLSVV